MTAGAKPQPTALRVLRGNPGKRPLPKNEPQPLLALEPPEPPAFLDGDAADEWRRVVVDLVAMNLLAMCDANVLAAYCVAFARWRAAETSIAERKLAGRADRGLTIDGGTKQSPLVRIAAQAAADMVKYAAEFGLTPSARVRLAARPVANSGEGQSKFAGLLA